MRSSEKAFPIRLIRLLSGLFLVISIIVFITMGFSVQYQDLRDTYTLAEETASFMQTECQKYDNYTQGNSARALQDLLDKATVLKTFFPVEKLSDSAFLKQFIHTEHLGGVLVLDSTSAPLAQADMDNQNSFSLLRTILSQDTVQDILQHPQKTYVDHVSLGHTPYDFAAAATADGSRLILCYASTEKPSTDPYELTLNSILKNNSFYKNPTLIITDGTKLLSTNNPLAEQLDAAQYRQIANSINWKQDQLTKFQYQDRTYYGLRRVYSSYCVYAVYPSDEVFSNRTNFLAFGFIIYLALCIIILAIQRHFDRLNLRKMEKQLGIINAISTSYSSTFLLHLDPPSLEPLKPSDRLKAVFAQHSAPPDFLTAICDAEVAPQYRPAMRRLLEPDTIAERLKNHSFLGSEMQDKNGKWYSVLLIPQKYGADGRVQSVLVTTRDITSMKQAEELSYKDKLTGLYNRNYMESFSRRPMRSTDFPVSLIMADCNYLKRTNDTLGHEYGDLLLRRIAAILRQTASPHDIVMRIGGDEFLLLCPQCSRESAQQLVADIKRRLTEQSDETLTLSASFGVSTAEADDFSFARAYEQADQAMYREKQAFHNRR